jgi:hypothetical protein
MSANYKQITNKIMTITQMKQMKKLDEFLAQEAEMIMKQATEKQGLILVVVTPKELGILKSGLVAQKKLMRGKIRNNERHAVAGDRPSWTEKDFETAIKKRKVQLADADMLKTRLENL